jgi:hypothetical protein
MSCTIYHNHKRKCWQKGIGCRNVDSTGLPLLHYICSRRIKDFDKYYPSILAHNDINELDSDNRTPLYYAAANNSFETCRILLENGADVEVTVLIRGTPLISPMVAAMLNYNYELCELLLRVKNNYLDRYLEIAACHSEYNICELLIEAGANIPRETYVRTDIRPLFVAYGAEFDVRIMTRNLPKYYESSRNGAFTRRKAASRWWFAVAAASASLVYTE